MQFGSPDARLALAPGQLWGRARSSMGGGVVWSALIVFLLTYAVASSTATAAWVNGIQVIPLIALGGAVLMAVLAVLPVPWPAGLGVGMILGPVVAATQAWPAMHAQHPLDVLNPGLIKVWFTRIADGSASSDPSFYLFLICWLMWVTGAWLSWCVLRWRKPMLGLIPGAAAFATNLLNFPQNQNGYTLSILVLTLALLLWTNYTGSIASANRAHVKLTGDARWDFWESGLVAMAALIVLGIMLPPLSTVDRTVDVESNLFSNWAQLQQRLSHPGIVGTGPGGAGTTGFSADVPLGGPLTRTRDPVFTYTKDTKIGDYASTLYFRGVDVTSTVGGEWRYAGAPGLRRSVAKNQVPSYAENYQALAYAGIAVKMLRPPIGNADIVFYPGELYRVDRPTVATQVVLPLTQVGNLYSVDRLSSVSPPTAAGSYLVTVEYSSATDAELKAAGTNYPDWLQQFSTVPASGYRTADVLSQIHDLALKIVTDAGATNPYDKATAIQNYLRDPQNFTYTLNGAPQAPVGTDRLWYFLFKSHKGYCEFFASAMGDMLRSLGIPTRLVNGFGPGSFDSTTNSFVVRGEDAHTWVESYFPSYGWIPFEPTPDISGGYEPITRGSQGQALCLKDENCDPGATTTTGGGLTSPSALPPGFREPSNSGSGPAIFRTPDAGTLTTIVGVLLALILLLGAAVARYLRPRTVMGVWKRTIAMSELAGAKRRPGETPLELGRRLQRTFPEASEPVGALAGGFMVAAYAPEDVAASSRSSVMEAWSALRPLLVRRVLARLRPNRA
ncbi:MAG TPA: transglutaminase domain-containing protein [Candidatus Dormibacteraeota bacterium]|nr:transglutaminase domain-containing protein [Candidatus Dormibacteraeota bacterium]